MIRKTTYSVVLLIIVLVITACSASNDYLSKFDAGDLEAANEIYETKIKDSPEEEKLIIEIKERADTIYNRFESMEIELKETNSNLNQLKKTNLESDYISELIKKASLIDKSRSSFSAGNGLIEKGKYLEGINKLEEVIEEDIQNYSVAQEIIESNKNNLEEYLVENANEVSGNQAIAYLKKHEAHDVTGKIKNELTRLIQLNTEEKITQADELAADNNYKAAIKLLESNSNYVDRTITNERINDYKNLEIVYSEERLKEIKNRVTINYDSVEKEYTIVAKGFSTRYNNLSRTINLEPRMTVDDYVSLSLYLGFVQNDWIFFDKLVFAIDDDRTTISMEFGDTQTQVLGGGTIQERTVLLHSDSYLLAGISGRINDFTNLINGIINSDSTTIRFQGDGLYRDHEVTSKEKQMLKDMWDLYNIINDNSQLRKEFLE